MAPVLAGVGGACRRLRSTHSGIVCLNAWDPPFYFPCRVKPVTDHTCSPLAFLNVLLDPCLGPAWPLPISPWPGRADLAGYFGSRQKRVRPITTAEGYPTRAAPAGFSAFRPDSKGGDVVDPTRGSASDPQLVLIVGVGSHVGSGRVMRCGTGSGLVAEAHPSRYHASGTLASQQLVRSSRGVAVRPGYPQRSC